MFTLLNTILLIVIIILLCKKKFYVQIDNQSDRNNFSRNDRGGKR